MSTPTDTFSEAPLFIRILGIMAVVGLSLVAIIAIIHLSSLLIGKLLPLLVIGAVLYVMVKIFFGSGRE